MNDFLLAHQQSGLFQSCDGGAHAVVVGREIAGTNFILHESPFYVTGDRTYCPNPRQPNRPPLFCLRTLQHESGLCYAFDHTNKAMPMKLRDVRIERPVAEDGQWNIGAERGIAERYVAVRALQASLKQHNAMTQTLDI